MIDSLLDRAPQTTGMVTAKSIQDSRGPFWSAIQSHPSVSTNQVSKCGGVCVFGSLDQFAVS